MKAVWGSLFFGFFLLATQKKETRKSRESDEFSGISDRWVGISFQLTGKSLLFVIFQENKMATFSEIKMKYIAIKSNFFTLSKRKREGYCKTIEALAFNSVFEQDIVSILKSKWVDKSWILEASGIFLGIIYTIIEIFKQMIEG